MINHHPSSSIPFVDRITVVQNGQESGHKYWVTCSSIRSRARGKVNDSMSQNDLFFSLSAYLIPQLTRTITFQFRLLFLPR